MTSPIPAALTVAGSDPSGGAGIQADLKTFSALGVYGCAVLTALTAQNTRQVTAVMQVPPHFLRAQLQTLFDDVRIDAIKVGMVGEAAAIEVVAEELRSRASERVVVDPVMVAKSGDRLLAEDAVAALRELLVPLATVITPNLPEAAVLLEEEVPQSLEEMEAMAVRLHALGPRAVLLKGGHLGGDESPDVFFDGSETHHLNARRIETTNTHGTGCTFSSAIAALLTRESGLLEAVCEAKRYVTAAIAAADDLRVGRGNGPVHHFTGIWR